MAALTTAKRIVVKIGSALLVDDDGAIRQDWLDALAEDIAEFRDEIERLEAEPAAD